MQLLNLGNSIFLYLFFFLSFILQLYCCMQLSVFLHFIYHLFSLFDFSFLIAQNYCCYYHHVFVVVSFNWVLEENKYLLIAVGNWFSTVFFYQQSILSFVHFGGMHVHIYNKNIFYVSLFVWWFSFYIHIHTYT